MRHSLAAFESVPVMTNRALAINLEAPDRGLAACFKGARLDEEYSKKFFSTYNLECLDDFVNYVPVSDTTKAEQRLEVMVNAVEASKDSGIHQARVRAAWYAARDALKFNSESAASRDDEDMDKPIPEGTLHDMQTQWDETYHIMIEQFLDPSDSLRGRTWREFRKKKASPQELRKVKSVALDRSHRDHHEVPVGSGVTLQFDAEKKLIVEDCVTAYFQLRTLANSWAFSGLVEMPSKLTKSATVQAMHLAKALSYADDALRLCMEYGGGDVAWFLDRDYQTRSKMATLIRRGYPPCEALSESLREYHSEWHSPGMARRVEEPSLTEEEVPPPPEPVRKRQRMSAAKQSAKANRQLPAHLAANSQQKVKTVAVFKGGARACKRYNDGRGCRGGCGAEHSCDLTKANGKACRSQSHTRLHHNPAKHE